MTAEAKNAEEGLRTMCRRVGLRLDMLDTALVARLALLGKCTSTLKDCDRAVRLADLVFSHFAEKGQPFSAVEEATVRIGAFLSDVGKTGPRHASPEQQRLVADMFAVERVPDGSISVQEFLRTYFPEDAEARCRLFEAMGLHSSMSMRDFWNLHSEWTLELIHNAGVLSESVAAAATHHLLEDMNPDSIVGEDGRFVRPFGTNLEFDRPEKLVIVLDKYDAARRRSGLTHEAAIRWLRKLVAKSARFRNDAEFEEAIQALEVVVPSAKSPLYPAS